jgi:hypothetical protein
MTEQNDSKLKFELDLADFHSNECRSLIQRFQSVEKLIGIGKHSPTEGAFCESMLRTFMRQVIPHQFSVDTGFVRGLPAKIPGINGKFIDLVASPQLDIIIHDTTHFSPIFRYDDVVVVHPEAVVAIIEVKKRLTSNTLKEALQNIYETRFIINDNTRHVSTDQVYMGVFAFSCGIAQPKEKPLSETYQKRLAGFVNMAIDPHLLPNAIIAAGSVAVIRDKTDPAKPAICSCYRLIKKGRDFSMQVFLYSLFKQIQMAERLTRVSRFSFLEGLDRLPDLSFTEKRPIMEKEMA